MQALAMLPKLNTRRQVPQDEILARQQAHRAANGGGRLLQLLTFAALLLVSLPASAHHFHISIAEAEWNDKAQLLEVALRVAPEDLERALGLKSGHLSVTHNMDEIISAYVKKRFFLRNKNGHQTRLVWVGTDLTTQYVWLYFEFPLPKTTRRLSLVNTIFFELEETQVNTVNVTCAPLMESWSFTHQEREQPLFSSDQLKQLDRPAIQPSDK